MRGPQLHLGLLVLLGTLQHASAQQAAEEAVAVANPNPLSGLSLESLEATRSLPLFTPSRTPPAVDVPVVEEVQATAPEEPQPEPDAPPPALQLIGIVLADSTQSALLRNSLTGEVLSLTSGDKFDQWSLKIIDARSVEFRQGDRVQGMKMFETFGPQLTGDPMADPFNEGMPPDMNVAPSEEGLAPEEGQEFSDPSAAPAGPASRADFAPELGNAPIPEEGPPPLEGVPNANQ